MSETSAQGLTTDQSGETASPTLTVGIAGGGQLAQMMIESAAHLDLDFVVLDPDPACSSSNLAKRLIIAPFDAFDEIIELGRQCDVLTFEIERINAQALAAVEQGGTPVRPSARVLNIIQDKLVQKQFLVEHNIPTSAFFELASTEQLAGQFPQVWKARRDGYDGRGVQVVRGLADVEQLPEVPALMEALVDIDYELAIMVARGADGTVLAYPLTEIDMDPDAHVMRRVIAPAKVPSMVEARCGELADQVVSALDYVGVLALEFFVDRSGQVLVNELSPRPHNSGHYTIEACTTSQFEQHLRAVAGLPLGAVTLHGAAVTFNVLGEPGANGVPLYVGFDQVEDGVHVHNYGKAEVRPGRKMAHVTVLGDTREQALALADRIQANLRVSSHD